MRRPELQPYTCPRCGYNCDRKDAFRRHFNRANMCYPIVEDMELTEAVKECVLKNRIYRPPPPPPVIVPPLASTPMNNIITQHNTMNNFIARLDTIDKLNRLTMHRQKDLMDFETKVESLYEKDVERFKNDTFRGDVELKQTHYMEMIHDVALSKEKDLEDMCVVFSKDDGRFYISMGCGEWDNYQKDRGLTYIIETLVACRLEFYEKYLIRKLEGGGSMASHAALRECLEEYYRFIGTFNVKPCVVGKSDCQIMYNDDDSSYNSDVDSSDVETFRIIDKYYAIYHRITTATPSSAKTACVKQVVDELKNSTKTNMKELNKRVMAILKVDEGFKQTIMASPDDNNDV